MLKGFVFFIISFISLNIVSQPTKIDWGKTTEVQRGLAFHKLIGEDDNGFYLLKSTGLERIDKNNIILEYYSLVEKEITESNELLLPSIDELPASYEDIVVLNNKVLLFCSISSKKKNKRTLYVQQLRKDGSQETPPAEVGNIPLDNLSKDGFKFQSIENEKLLIHFHRSFKAYNNESLSFLCMNSNGITEWKKDIVLPLTFRKFFIEDYLYKNNNIYLGISAVMVSKKKSRSGVDAAIKYDKYVYTINTNTDSIIPFKVNLGKNLPANMAFNVDDEGIIYAAGFFRSKTMDKYIGSYFQKYNPNTQKVIFGGITKHNNVKLPKDQILAFNSKRVSKLPENLYKYKPIELVLLEDGKAIFVSEHYYTTSKSVTDPATKHTSVINSYFYNDVVMFGIDTKGAISWLERIAKNQFSIDDNGYFSSIALLKEANSIKIIFNDNPANISAKDKSKIKEFRSNAYKLPKGLATTVTIDGSGSVNKDVLFEKANSQAVFGPKLLYPSKNGYIIYLQNTKKYKFGTF